jgi:hypothetical protein
MEADTKRTHRIELDEEYVELTCYHIVDGWILLSSCGAAAAAMEADKKRTYLIGLGE